MTQFGGRQLVLNFNVLHVELQTPRFTVRTLYPEDVTTAYAKWFSDEIVMRYIQWHPRGEVIHELQDYVAHHLNDHQSLLLGVFEKKTGHIANIKYDPIDVVSRTATLGVLIGARDWRNRGLFGEVFSATAGWLRETTDVTRILLGVDMTNSVAFRTYLRAGFRLESAVPDIGYRWMSIRI